MPLKPPSYVLKQFDQINTLDIYQILKLRSAVFVSEQNCAYLDLDDIDQQALHLFQKSDDNHIIAYARILPPALSNGQFTSIGRVVVAQSHRQLKLGRALMEAAIDQAQNLYPDHPIKISAQTYLTRFYQSLGFINTGVYYLEDDIPHQEMVYQTN
ncbi:GNAT family N-acetyltransferase [Marinicella litoralis]|uniref:ElaA protein n=1 Tax=Marinicella litoralis TaxID=644220 RepID=A0A4R6XUU9_9GAMM|nr:GNAT family N-acetyltransferase [Marinicella litoralis]TDR23785.1 ElaA protein [Marinicella litoralis]